MSERTTRALLPAETPAGILRRIRFAAAAPPDAAVLRRFEDGIIAAETVVAAGETSPADWPEPTDQLELLILPQNESAATREQIDRFLQRPDFPDAPRPADVRLSSAFIHWRPGRAVVRAGRKQVEQVVAGLVEFSYHEGKLRRLEQELEPAEASARSDVTLAYDVRHVDRAEWPRLKATMRSLAGLRLSLARVQPMLYEPPRSLDLEARRLYRRLIVRAQIEHRLEMLSDRLEACEDLYEGAIDRVADFRWYRKGNLLEIAIVILLAGELLLLLFDVFLRLHERTNDERAGQVMPGRSGGAVHRGQNGRNPPKRDASRFIRPEQ